MANARRGQIETKRRAKSAHADHQNARLLELQLPVHANFRHDEVAAIPQNLFARKVRTFNHFGLSAHELLPFGLHSIPCAAGDGWHNADGVAIFDWRVFLVEIADVFVLQIDIDEAADTAIFGVEVPA